MAFLEEEFVKKVPASVSAIFFILVTYIILRTDLFCLLDGFPYFCPEQFKGVSVASRFFIKFAKDNLSQSNCYFAFVVKPGCVPSVWGWGFIVSFAISIRFSVKCFIRAVLFGSWTSLRLHNVLNCCQLALFVFQLGGLLLSWMGWVVLSIMGKWSLPQESLSYLPNPSARAGYDTRSIF